jgi:hypothetical protein
MLAPSENPTDGQGVWIVLVAMIAFTILITALVLLGAFD